jgi:hypothetical protein
LEEFLFGAASHGFGINDDFIQADIQVESSELKL